MKEAEFKKYLWYIQNWKIKDVFTCPKKGINDQQALELALAISQNPFITAIDLSDNLISDKSIYAFVKILSNPNSFNKITSIDLSGNLITDSGASALLNSAYQHYSLANLNLARNKIKTLAVLPKFQAQKKNLTVNLAANPITEEHRRSLSQTLQIQLTFEKIAKGIDPKTSKKSLAKVNPHDPVNLNFSDKLKNYKPNDKLDVIIDNIIKQAAWPAINASNLTILYYTLARRFKTSQEYIKPFINNLLTDNPRKLSIESFTTYSKELKALSDKKTQMELSVQTLRLANKFKAKQLTDILCALAVFKNNDPILINEVLNRMTAIIHDLKPPHLLRIIWAISMLDLPKEKKQDIANTLYPYIDLKYLSIANLKVKNLLKLTHAFLEINLPDKELSEILGNFANEIFKDLNQKMLDKKCTLKNLLDYKEILLLEKVFKNPVFSKMVTANHMSLYKAVLLEIETLRKTMPKKMEAKPTLLTLAQARQLIAVVQKKLAVNNPASKSGTAPKVKASLTSPLMNPAPANSALQSEVNCKTTAYNHPARSTGSAGGAASTTSALILFKYDSKAGSSLQTNVSLALMTNTILTTSECPPSIAVPVSVQNATLT